MDFKIFGFAVHNEGGELSVQIILQEKPEEVGRCVELAKDGSEIELIN